MQCCSCPQAPVGVKGVGKGSGGAVGSIRGTFARRDRRFTDHSACMQSSSFRTFHLCVSLVVVVVGEGRGGVHVLADTDEWEPNLLVARTRSHCEEERYVNWS